MFSRNPQPLQNLTHWKATEYRAFLLYYGPIALHNSIDSNKYKHFMLLNIAISILVSTDLVNNYAHIAKQLCRSFVEESAALYKDTFLIYNVHSLIHIADDAMRFGGLDYCSAFRFENFLSKMKRLIRKGNFVIKQLAARYSELEDNPKQALPKIPIKNNDAFRLDEKFVIVEEKYNEKYICKVYDCNNTYNDPIPSLLLGVQSSLTDLYILQDLDADLLVNRCMYYINNNNIIFISILHYYDV